MRIATLSEEQHAEFLDLVDAEIRPDRAKSHAWEDFPLILGAENRKWCLGASDEAGRLMGGLACLIRGFETSCGNVPVAGVGSVVTREEFRGRGISSALQNEMLSRLKGKNVPLAVLWTDQPEIYAGRGFRAAGWEWHVDLGPAGIRSEMPAGFELRPFEPADTDAVVALYRKHALRTRRFPGDAARLYGMPGTTGLLACGDDGVPAAAVFCGKGADFPRYVTEWSGAIGLVEPLLGTARERGLVDHVLIPAGSERLLEVLAARGATWTAQPSGQWNVLLPKDLARYLEATGQPPPADLSDPTALLGGLDEAGDPFPGVMTMAVWGFDSV